MAKADGDRVTYYVALPFDRSPGGDLFAGEAKECPHAGAAEREARRLALAHAGAVAFSRKGEILTGEIDEAVIFVSMGDALTLDMLVER